MEDAKRNEFEFRASELVSHLVRTNSNETVELVNWLNQGKLLLLSEPSDIGGEDDGQNWNVLAQPDGAFDRLAFYLRRRAPKESGEILRKEVLPVLRGNLDSPEEYLRRQSGPSAENTSSRGGEKLKRRNYSIWGYPHDKEHKYLKSIEQKWEWGGFFLGPLWILIKGGPPLLALIVLAAAVGPFLAFSINALTVVWFLIVWIPSARCHAGIWAMKLKSIGHVRLR
ncbi:hypothetical protein FZO89_00265 [Luteimonas viscosa]|uniref:DUF2628 domain-containing protein n=1 Tax=Luteimonas viscosa TaxID=1132694 RepID=A0A5D4XJJ6_9GAMM|nr:hypothetical protein [Luteimonas viscosa]TYT24838.1 hypothetical protein FZO89_00265 [Luteimonas viscosa]